LTRLAWQHLGLQAPTGQDAQVGLFDDPDPADA
jgi:hypothetical protein